MNENYSLSITKEALAELPVVSYAGGITVIDTMEKARIALRALRRHKLVGFDTETRPSFQKGRLHKVALMQLSTGDHCYLFRLNKLGIFDALKDFLEDESVVKVGLSVHDDFSVIRRSRDIEPKGFVELQSYIKDFRIADISLQKIYAIVFSCRISKTQRLTNWESETLTDGQQAYAALDAWACLHLYKHLRAGLFDPERSPYKVMPEIETPADCACG